MPIRLLPVTPSANGCPLLLGQLLRAPLATVPGQQITYRGEVRHTYAELHERVGRLASALAALGVRPGDTVAVMDWDSHRYLECFFAVPMMGAVLQTVNIRLSPEQVLYTLNHAGPRTLLVHADFLPLLERLRPGLATVRVVVLLSDAGVSVALPEGVQGQYEALLARADPRFDFPEFDENAQATTFYTTGTTGEPKGVGFSHRQLVLHTLALAAMLGSAPGHGRLHREDVYMPLTPMFHVHAWGLPYLATMLGLKQVYPGPYQPALIARLIAEEGVTYSHCVPTVFNMVLSHPAAAEVDLSGWKVVIGGSALPESMVLAAMRRGIDLFGGYGLSETCPVLSICLLDGAQSALPPEAQAPLRAKAGRPLPLVELRVVDETLAEVAHDGSAVGEVLARAPWLTQGYTGQPEASEQLWRGGYLHTADLGTIDEAGYLKVVDRIKDVVKVGGEWVSSLALEELIAGHEAVLECAVVAVPADKWGERPLALVVLKPGCSEEVTEQVIRRHAVQAIERSGASRYGATLQVLLVKRLLRTSVGKLDKARMRQDPSALTREP